MRVVLAVLFLTLATFAQSSAPPVSQDTAGPCSVAINGNNNQVFTCQGFDEKTTKQILAIVNRIAVKQLDPAVVMEKLNEIQKSLGDIKQINAQRHITADQRARILPLLKAAGPQELFFVCSPDPESQAYFNELAQMFHEARWEFVPHPPNWGTTELYPQGVQILVATLDTDVPHVVLNLQGALKTGGIDAPASRFIMMPPQKFALYVGPKAPASH
jgi:hypothetical protein